MRINRLRRALVKTRGGLTDTQREMLTYGDFMFTPGPGFHDEESERAAWFEHRDEILAEMGNLPGRRPAGYFKYELKANPNNSDAELSILLDNGLIGPQEARDLERQRPILSNDATVFDSFENESLLRRMGHLRPILEGHAQAFEVAAKWHTWRGREALAERYRLRRDTVQRVLGASATPMEPPLCASDSPVM
jgi:hypothetical protein